MNTNEFVDRIKHDPFLLYNLVKVDDVEKELKKIDYTPEKQFLKYINDAIKKIVVYASDQIHVLEIKAESLKPDKMPVNGSGVNGSSGSNW